MRRLKLADIVLEPGDFLAGSPEVLYRMGENSHARYSRTKGMLKVSGTVDFCSYFNMLPIQSWTRYCSIRSARLRLDVVGDEFTVHLRAFKKKGEHIVADIIKTMTFDASETVVNREMDVPFIDAACLGFIIETEGEVSIKEASYYVLVDEKRMLPVRLNICMANYPNEGSVMPNLFSFYRHISETGESVSDRVHFTIIDNDDAFKKQIAEMQNVPELPELTVLPVRNRGRAGSMASAMSATLDDPGRFTHLVFIDKDTRVHPESIRRIYTMLTLLAPEHVMSTISGGYFRMSNPYRRLGDVYRVIRWGATSPVKKSCDVNRAFAVALDIAADTDVANAYAPWNFTVLPVSIIREHGLPMPVYVRADDMEYGLRTKSPCITMPGIASWDADVRSRLGDEITCYQLARNTLIANAITNSFSQTLYMFTFWRNFRIFLRYLNYSAAELWLDALEDYLKGPSFLVDVNGYQLVHNNRQKAETLRPLTELHEDSVARDAANKHWLDDIESPNAVRRLFETIPHDSHYLPQFLLIKKPGIVGVHGNATPWRKTAFRQQLVALGATGDVGDVRVMDKARFKALNQRASELKMLFRNTNKAVALQYQDEFRRLTSKKFWESVD